jgi:3'(2'), 5'-bisphosphate nucleotidase
MNDHELAGRLARQAGQLLLEVRAEAQREGVDDKELRSRGDNRANDLILAGLAKERPDDAILSEESKDSQARLSASRVWIVDPLDGTREYAEGRDDWAVHVALVSGGSPIAGAVALPGLDKVLVTKPAPTVVGSVPKRPRLIVSRTRPPKVAEYLAERLDADLVPMGSAGAKTMAIVLGQADVYAHAGGQYEWDSCAPVAVAAAAGLHTSRLDGSPLVYNNADPYLPDLLVCRPELEVQVRAAIATAPPGSFETA